MILVGLRDLQILSPPLPESCAFAHLRFCFCCRARVASASGNSAARRLAREPTPFEETIKPTFETQKLARTYVLDIPAPRGQITDRNGAPLAQNKLSYNLAINFPTPLDFSDAQALAFAREKIRGRREIARAGR